MKNAIEEILKADVTQRRVLQLIPAKYSISQLHEWYSQVVPMAFANPNIVSTDLNEGLNRIEIGMSSQDEDWNGDVDGDGTEFYQPTTDSNTNLIGEETIDPPLSSGLDFCEAGNVCRMSDAAFVRLESGVSQNVGKIAKTTYGSPSVSHSAKFRIKNDYAPSLVGDTVNKVGKETGWTRATVTNTCKNTP